MWTPNRITATLIVLLLSVCAVQESHAEAGTAREAAPAQVSGDVQPLVLEDLMREVMARNPEILASEARASALAFKIPQARSLPDPMIMFGYQNDGFKKYTYGKSDNAYWMFSASQMFFFPGKQSLKGEMAARDAQSQQATYAHVRLKALERVKELFYDLLFTYKYTDIVRERASLLTRIEDAALARYSSAMGSQQEVLMAQTEKYMLLEREQMLQQKVQSLEAMLNNAAGRDVNAPLGRPVEPQSVPPSPSLEDLLETHVEHSPLVKSKELMVAAAEAKVQMAKREYYPDFTVNASYFKLGGDFEDMWSLTTTVNIPLYYAKKQRQAVYEAEALLSEARHELEGTKLMLSSTIRDNYSMLRTADKLMALYRDALIPKSVQDFELALSGYVTGKVEAITVISRLKSLLDFEIQYWAQFAERGKAVARIETATGLTDYAMQGATKE